MQRPERHVGIALLLLLPGLATGDAEAKMMSGPGWQCNAVGIAVGGGDFNWSWHCISTGGGGGASVGGSPISGGGGSVGGPGSGARPPRTAKEQETDDRTDASSCGETAGNPIVLYTGNKVEPEIDFVAAGEMGLHLRRTYNRMWSGVGLFGKHWLSNFDYSLAFSGGMAWAQRPDGRRIKFVAAPENRWHLEKGSAAVHIIRNADGTYTLHNEERGTETYNADGYITQRVNEQGVKWAFAYSGKYLQRVTHSSGRSVQLAWTNGQVTQVTDPAGNAYRYSYAPDVFGAGRGRLSTTTLPGSPATAVTYHYEDNRYAGALTGKSLNGVRYSTFAYDGEGRAASTEHAGGVARHTFAYAVEGNETLPTPPPPPPPGGFFSDDERGGFCTHKMCTLPRSGTGPATQVRPTRFRVTETNPLGLKTTHLYEDGRKVSVTGHASPSCAARYRELTYDANGFQDIVSDFTDRLTDFDYDAEGRLLKTVEAAGTLVARTSQMEWHNATNRLVRVTVLGDRETRYTWHDNGRLASESITDLSGTGVPGQTRTTNYRYTHHDNGLLATSEIDGPLPNDTITSSYDSTGDLLRLENALGHVTRYAQYNGLGQPGHITSPAGAVREYVYDARGRVIVQRTFPNSVPVETRYVYGASGLLDAIHTTDGNTVVYHYDAARRLIQEDRTEPDGTFAVRRTTYNAMSLPTRIEVGRDE